jgi:hypothetical protein
MERKSSSITSYPSSEIRSLAEEIYTLRRITARVLRGAQNLSRFLTNPGNSG